MDHTHRWRATSKVFALVCECGATYHEWLLAEIDRLKAAALPSPAAEEVATLRVQLEEARGQIAAVCAELDEARQELEAYAEKVTSQIVA